MTLGTVRLAVIIVIGWQRLEAVQVNITSLLPSAAFTNFVKTDADGNIYVAGTVRAPFGGVFLAKISADGTKLIYNTGIGASPVGGQSVGVNALAVSPDGSAFVLDSFTAQFSGTFSSIVKIDPSGAVLFSGPTAATRVSPILTNFIQDMTVDADGNLYVTGTSGSFPASSDALSNPLNAGFIYKFDPTLTTVLWAVSGYGGTNIAVGSNKNVYVVGATTSSVPTTANAFQTSYKSLLDPTSPASSCGFSNNQGFSQNLPCAHQYVAAIDGNGSQLIYLTYVSGEFDDVPAGIVVDAAGVAYVAGSTHSFDFPTTAGVVEPDYSAQAPNSQFDYRSDAAVSATGYVSAINPSGTGLVFSTFFGGSATDLITSIALVQSDQLIELGGSASSPDFPGVEGAYRHCIPQSFITRLTLDGTANQRTALIPALIAFAPIANDKAFFSGGQTTGVVDFAAADTPIACLADSVDLSVSSTVAPGQLLTIFGNQLAADAETVTPINGSLGTFWDGVQVTIGGFSTPLLYVSPDQINLQVPFEIAGASQVQLQLSASNAENFAVSDTRPLNVISVNPSVLQVPDDCLGSYLGRLISFVVNADGSLNSCSNPAQLNSAVTIFVDGLGALAPGVTGMVNSPTTAPPLTVTFESSNQAPVPTLISAKPVAGAVSGFFEFQIQLPSSAPNRLVQATMAINGSYATDGISIPVTP